MTRNWFDLTPAARVDAVREMEPEPDLQDLATHLNRACEIARDSLIFEIDETEFLLDEFAAERGEA